MKTAKPVLWSGLVVQLLIFSSLAFGQTDSLNSRIQISSFVEKTEVALNRSVELTVTLSWIGEPDRYTIENFDNPALSNFDITGTSTVNRSEVRGGQTHVFKDYIYTLKPRELGMAYIEGVVVNCRDTILSRNENLLTQRIPVEVLDPIPEPTEMGSIWIYLFIFLVIIGVGGGFLVWRARKKRELDQEIPEEIPISRTYLNRLKEEINLETPNLRDDFANISRLMRRFLSEQFKGQGLEGTTEELVRSLNLAGLEENHASNFSEILTRCDEIKFSGVDGRPEELHRFYTLFEAILQSVEKKPEQVSAPDKPEKES